MRFNKLSFFLLTGILLSVLMGKVSALTLNIETGKPMGIRDGIKVWFGTEWISTTGTDIHLSEWNINWISYSCSIGSQQIHVSNKPGKVYIDEIERSENDGWSYSAGIVNVTAATQSVTIQRFYVDGDGDEQDGGLSPFGGREDYLIKFYVTMAGVPVAHCRIDIYELPEESYKTVLFTDNKGHAETYLQAGHYLYNATSLDRIRRGTFWVAGEDTVRIEFGKQRLSISPQIMVLLLIGAIIVVAAIGISRAKY